MIGVLSCHTLSAGIARRDTNDHSNQFKRVVFIPEIFLSICQSPITEVHRPEARPKIEQSGLAIAAASNANEAVVHADHCVCCNT